MPGPENDAESTGGEISGEPLVTPQPDAEELHRRVAALESLSLLTRTVFLLKSLDDLSYKEIGWRCGISVDEVTVRMTDGLAGMHRAMRGRVSWSGHVRRALLPWRDAWAAARMREQDRRLAPWYPPDKRPGKRGPLEWIAWAFEKLAR